MNESHWQERYRTAEIAFHELKAITKKVPASSWTKEYRELAEAIHCLGREVFYGE